MAIAPTWRTLELRETFRNRTLSASATIPSGGGINPTPTPSPTTKLALYPVPTPEGPLSLLSPNRTTFTPSTAGFAVVAGVKLFAEFDNPYGVTPKPANSTNDAVAIDIIDDAGYGLRAIWRGASDLGPNFGWQISTIDANSDLSATLAINNYNAAIGAPINQYVGPKHRAIYTGSKIQFLCGEEIVGETTARSGLRRVRVNVPSGSGRTAITGLRYGAVATPILVRSTSLTSDQAVDIQFDYTNLGAAMDVPNLQLFYADGVTPYGAKHKPTLVTNTTAGAATIRSTPKFSSAQNGTAPQFALYEVVDGVETGFVARGTITMPAAPARFGANIGGIGVRYGGVRTMADAFREGIYQDYANGYVGVGANEPGKTDVFGWPLAGSTLKRQIGKGDYSGQPMVITWQGNGSIASLTSTEGDFVVTERTPLTSNSYRYNATFTRTGIGGNSFGGITFTIPAGGTMTNIKIYPEGEDRTAFWAPSYLVFQDKSNIWNGAGRQMDSRNINGNGRIDMTWAMRTLPDDLGGGYDGISIERLIELHNAIGRDLYLPLPAFATTDYCTQLAIAINTGANLSQGKPWSNGLAAGLKWYVSRGNEVWNPDFANFDEDRTRYCARTGETRLGDSTGGPVQGFKEHAFQYDRMISAIMTAIPNYADRIVRVMETQQDPTQYNVAIAAGLVSKIDAWAIAPYFSITASIVNALPNKLPATLEVPYLAQIDTVMENLKPLAAKAKANGHRFITYEGGMDFAAGNKNQEYLTGVQINAFRTSPSYYKCVYRYKSLWKSNHGDLFTNYTDQGGSVGVYQWGLLSYQGQNPAYGVLALQDVIAGLPSRY